MRLIDRAAAGLGRWHCHHLLLLLLLCTPGACGGEEGSGGTDGGVPPDTNIDEVLAPFAGLCPNRQDELLQELCPGGQEAVCDPGCTYYLSTEGDDGLDGRSPSPSGSGGPWQTLDRLAEVDLTGGEIVCFRRGDTFRGRIELPWGLHSSQSPVVFQSYGHRALPQPIISGSKLVPAEWTQSPLDANIMQVDLSGVLWTGEPFERYGQTYIPHDRVFQLFADGQLQVTARFPNPGEGDSTIVGVDLEAGHYSTIDSVPGGGRYLDTALPTTSPLMVDVDLTGAQVFYRSNRWIIMSTEVASHDAANQQLLTAEPLECASQDCLGWGWFLLDHPALLDSPGEWYYDWQTRILYFWPPDGLSLQTATIEVSTYQEDMEPPEWADPNADPEIRTTIGLDLQGDSGIRVRDLSFRHYSRAAIFASSDLSSASADLPPSTTDIRVEGCELLYTGASGVVLARWSAPADVGAANRVSGCTFRGQTSQAVVVRTTDTEVSCNQISDTGLLEEYPRFGMTRSEFTVHDQGMAVVAERDGARLLFNRFIRTSSAGISFRAPDAIVAFNVIQNACYTKSDCGGIHTYTWDSSAGFDTPSVRGSVVARNIVLETLGAVEGAAEDVRSPLGQGMFLDFGAQEYTVKQNVVAGSTTCGLLVQRNRNVSVEENLLYDNTRYNAPSYLLGGLAIVNDMPPTLASVRGNSIYALTPVELPLSIRGDTVEEAGVFSSNTYFFPYAFDNTSEDNRWSGYTVHHAGSEGGFTLYSLPKWMSVSGEEDAAGTTLFWPAYEVTSELSENLIVNGSFDDSISGWSTETWSDSQVAADVHPVLGACLRYERNGAEGGRIGALSTPFHVDAGSTYWVHLWIAPDPEAAEPLSPQILIETDASSWYIPGDAVREVTYLYTARSTTDEAQFELSSYPLYGDRYWIDDVEVKEVTARPYRSAAIVRFDQTIPSDSRSVLIYNDTESPVTVNGVSSFVLPDGSPAGDSMEIRAFGGVVLIAEDWAQNPTKTL